MGTDVLEALGDQSVSWVAQPLMDSMTPEEWLVLSFYRQLEGADKLILLRMLEAIVSRQSPS